MKDVFVTTSWDDGHKLDKKLADLLIKYGIKGTFYLSPKDREIKGDERLSDEEIINLSRKFEIGGHTLTHPRLSLIGDQEAETEILEGKKYLENVIGKKIESFCYPGGDFSDKHLSMVKEAGFKIARTVCRFNTKVTKDLFQIPTTIHAYKHNSDIINILKSVGIKKFIKAYLNWDYLAIQLFDNVMRSGGVFHLWGHSWEIEKNGDWERLENVLKYISRREHVKYIENNDLVGKYKKKIAIVTPYFPPEGGGLERYAKEIAKGLSSSHDFKVVVITSTKCIKNKAEEITDGDLKIYKLHSDFKISNTPFSFRWFLNIYKIFKNEQPDLINIHMPVPGIGDVAALVYRKKPVIVTYHSGSMRKMSSRLNCMVHLYEKLFLPVVLRRANKIICSSEYVSKNFLNKYNYKNTVITPGVDYKMFIPDSNLKTKYPSLLFVAGLNKSEEYKGLMNLLVSVTEIKKVFDNIKLVVVGDGDMRGEYEKFVNKNNLQENVVFIGRRYQYELVNEYKKAHVFVQPSSNESFSMVILEAMASALPVVAINVGGTKDMVTDGFNGFILESNSPKLLSEKIIYLLNNKNLIESFGKNGRDVVVDQFDWSKKIDSTVEIVNNFF